MNMVQALAIAAAGLALVGERACAPCARAEAGLSYWAARADALSHQALAIVTEGRVRDACSAHVYSVRHGGPANLPDRSIHLAAGSARL